MEAASFNITAAPFTVMVTNEGEHSAEQWAATTADLIMNIAPDASTAIRQDFSTFRHWTVKALTLAFHEASASSSPNFLHAIAVSATNRIADITPTRWAYLFTSSDLRQSITDLIARNLLTMREIALKTE
jgi:hypothetical protein